MQTRRRLQSVHINQDFSYSQDESQYLVQQTNSSNIPTLKTQATITGGTSVEVIAVEPIDNNFTNQLLIDEDIDENRKYSKGGWNLRSLSNRIHISSGNALRTFIQQPLTAAAAVVTGTANYSESQTTNNNYYGSKGEYCHSDQNKYTEDDILVQKEDILIMAARDRTSEFANAIRSLQSRNITRAVNIKDPRKVKQVQSYSEFMSVAKYIGKNIASTYVKLEKLTLLAKKKGIFDDRPQEIQELTYIIKGDLNALNQQIARLQEISKDQRRTSHGKHLVSHSSNMVLALQSKLASMSTDFKQILEVRTENLKQQKTRRDQFSQVPVAQGLSAATAKQGSLLLSEENQMISIDMSPGDSENRPLLGGTSGRQMQTQQQLVIYDESDNYVQQRAETMQNIESTIVELGGIFQQLAHMVKEQEEIVERIDSNVQDAELNIEAAHGEILKYFHSVSKNRWLMIKIFGVLIFFFIFFVVFLA